MSLQNQRKLAPHSKDTEMIVLGSMLTNNKTFISLSEELDDSDFYFDEHKVIFRSLKNLHLSGKLGDVHLLSVELKGRGELDSIGGISYLVGLAQFPGTSSNIEEYTSILRNKSALRKLLEVSKSLENKALDGPHTASSLLEEVQNTLKSIETDHGKKLPIIGLTQRLEKEEQFLKDHRGKEYIGLKVSSINEFNEKFLGLRGLILLAAAPNVGKTALTIQLALEMISEQENVCLAYFSLEMTEEEIFRRMLLSLSKTDFKSLVFGSNHLNSGRIDFSQNEYNNIELAKKKLTESENRIQIIDTKTCPFLDAKLVINYVENLKEKTKCNRAVVIIDYLQVWPLSSNVRFANELESDKWRIGEMKKIKDAMKNDPTIVISEARKPQGSGDAWGGDMSDIMGSARGSYTPDAVILLTNIGNKDLSELWKKHNLPKISNNGTSENEEIEIKNLLNEIGISLIKLRVPKGRDGMERFEVILQFYFRQNNFEKMDWGKFKGKIINYLSLRKNYLNS